MYSRCTARPPSPYRSERIDSHDVTTASTPKCSASMTISGSPPQCISLRIHSPYAATESWPSSTARVAGSGSASTAVAHTARSSRPAALSSGSDAGAGSAQSFANVVKRQELSAATEARCSGPKSARASVVAISR